MAGTATITVKDLSNPSVPVLTETLSVTPSTQSAEWVEYQGQQVSTSNPLTVSANTPVALTVANVDAAGNLLPVTSTQAGTNSYITVNLSDTNGGAYTLVPGGAPVTSVEIPVGQTSVTVYYVNATAKTITGGLTAQ